MNKQLAEEYHLRTKIYLMSKKKETEIKCMNIIFLDQLVNRNDIFKKVSREMKDLKDNLNDFKEIPVNSMSENSRILMEYNAMNKVMNELAKKFESLGKRFQAKEE